MVLVVGVGECCVSRRGLGVVNRVAVILCKARPAGQYMLTSEGHDHLLMVL